MTEGQRVASLGFKGKKKEQQKFFSCAHNWLRLRSVLGSYDQLCPAEVHEYGRVPVFPLHVPLSKLHSLLSTRTSIGHIQYHPINPPWASGKLCCFPGLSQNYCPKQAWQMEPRRQSCGLDLTATDSPQPLTKRTPCNIVWCLGSLFVQPKTSFLSPLSKQVMMYQECCNKQVNKRVECLRVPLCN